MKFLFVIATFFVAGAQAMHLSKYLLQKSSKIALPIHGQVIAGCIENMDAKVIHDMSVFQKRITEISHDIHKSQLELEIKAHKKQPTASVIKEISALHQDLLQTRIDYKKLSIKQIRKEVLTEALCSTILAGAALRLHPELLGIAATTMSNSVSFVMGSCAFMLHKDLKDLQKIEALLADMPQPKYLHHADSAWFCASLQHALRHKNKLDQDPLAQELLSELQKDLAIKYTIQSKIPQGS